MPTINIANKEFRVKDKSEVKTRDWIRINRTQKEVSKIENGLDQVEAFVALIQVLVPDLTVDDLDIPLEEVGKFYTDVVSLCIGKEVDEEPAAGEDSAAPKE